VWESGQDPGVRSRAGDESSRDEQVSLLSSPKVDLLAELEEEARERERLRAVGGAGVKEEVKEFFVPEGQGACNVADRTIAEDVVAALPVSVRRGEHFYVFTHIPKAAGSAVLKFAQDRLGCGHFECRECKLLKPEDARRAGCIVHRVAEVRDTPQLGGTAWTTGAYTSVQRAMAEPAWRCACPGCCRIANACGHKGHRRRKQIAGAVHAAIRQQGDTDDSAAAAAESSPDVQSDPSVRLFVMLRDPLIRTLSSFRHAKRATQVKWACCGLPMQLYRDVNRPSGGSLGLEAFLSHGGVRNTMTKMLAGLGPGDMRVDWEAEREGIEDSGGGANRTLHAALAALEEMDFVGIKEEYEESLRQLAVWMGLETPPSKRDAAVHNSQGDEQQLRSILKSVKIAALVRAANAEDEIVYHRALEIFQEQKKRWPKP